MQAIAHGFSETVSETEGVIRTPRWITALGTLRYADLFASGEPFLDTYVPSELKPYRRGRCRVLGRPHSVVESRPQNQILCRRRKFSCSGGHQLAPVRIAAEGGVG
jgi:hypothetical protein